MTITEEFQGIVEREGDATAFLKSLNKEQKKELYPALKKLQKHYSEYVKQQNSLNWSPRGTTTQNQILSFAAFICFNQKDFEQSTSYGIINREDLTPIL